MTKTINGLTVTTSAASSDLLPIWRAANNDTRAITKANFMGGVLTGGGTIATGGFTLTVAAASTINGSVVGNMTGGGTVATEGNTLTVGGTSSITGTLSGAGTVATGGFTLTVPATGTAALLGTSQTFSALKTFSAGISLGNDTLSLYDFQSWTPALNFGGATTGITYSTQSGRLWSIGKINIAEISLTLTSKGSATGNATIEGLPILAYTANGGGAGFLRYYTNLSSITSATQVRVSGSQTIITQAGSTQLTDANFANNSRVDITLIYMAE